MKDMTDKEIQEMAANNLSSLDTSISSADEKDIHSYSLLFEALGKEPPLPLTHHFAAKVTAAIQADKNRSSDFKLWILVSSCFLVAITVGFYYLIAINSINSPQLMLYLLKYKWVLIFAAAAFSIIQFLDNRFVNKSIDR